MRASGTYGAAGQDINIARSCKQLGEQYKQTIVELAKCWVDSSFQDAQNSNRIHFVCTPDYGMLYKVSQLVCTHSLKLVCMAAFGQMKHCRRRV